MDRDGVCHQQTLGIFSLCCNIDSNFGYSLVENVLPKQPSIASREPVSVNSVIQGSAGTKESWEACLMQRLFHSGGISGRRANRHQY